MIQIVFLFDFVELSSDIIMTRGNEYKLAQHHCHYDFKKYNLVIL